MRYRLGCRRNERMDDHPHLPRRHAARRLQTRPRLLGSEGHQRRPRCRNPEEDRQEIPADEHDFRGHAAGGALPECEGMPALRLEETGRSRRPAEPLLRLHRTRLPRLRRSHRRVQAAHAGTRRRLGRIAKIAELGQVEGI